MTDEYKYKIIDVLKDIYQIHGREADEKGRNQTLWIKRHDESSTEGRIITWMEAENIYFSMIVEAPSSI